LKQFLSILGSFVLGLSIFSMVQVSYGQSSEDNERLMACHDYKGKFVADNPDAFLINCIEYVASDYDSVEEYLTEEHPEIKLK
jgi:hypothetical protein